MRTPDILLEVGPRAIELSGPRGLRLRAQLTPAAGRDGETIDMPALAEALSAWAGEHRLAKRTVGVIFESATSVTGVVSCPRSIGEAAALDAAATASDEWTEAAPGGNALGAAVATVDPKDEHAQIHAVAICEHETTIATFHEAVASSGMRVAWMTTATAALMTSAHRRAQQLSAQGPVLVLELGTRGTMLCAAEHGRIVLAREAGVGVETFVSALHYAKEDCDATRALFENGVPIVAEADDATSDERSTLAALQPVLQRLTAELRQSVRFGLDEHSRDATLFATGGYADAIPGLGHYLAERIGLAALDTPGQDARGRDAEGTVCSGSHGLIAAARGSAGRGGTGRGGAGLPSVMPEAMRVKSDKLRLRRAIWAGAAMAMLALIVEGNTTFSALSEAKAARQTMSRHVNDASEALAAAARTKELSQTLDFATTRAQATLGGQSRLGAATRALAMHTPPHIAIGHAVLNHGADGSTVSITGHVDGTTASSTGSLRDYAATLEALPFVRDVALGPAMRTNEDGLDVLSFSLELTLAAFPAFAPGDAAAGSADKKEVR